MIEVNITLYGDGDKQAQARFLRGLADVLDRQTREETRLPLEQMTGVCDTCNLAVVPADFGGVPHWKHKDSGAWLCSHDGPEARVDGHGEVYP